MTQRTILFRGKRLDIGEWVYGDYFKHDKVKVCFTTDDPKTKHRIISDGSCDWGFEPPMEYCDVDPETVGQFIGLYDRKSQPIFEGDILRYYSDALNDFVGGPCVVKYGEFNCSCCGGVYGWEFEDGDIRDYQYYEIIGNIHDNEV